MPPVRVAPPQGHVFINGQRAFFPQHGIFFRHRFHHRSRFFFNTCFDSFGNPFFCDPFFSSCFNGFGCGSPFFGSSFILPFYQPLFPNYSPPPEQQPVAVEEDSHTRELALQVQELSDEIQSMRDEERRRESAKSAGAQPAPRDEGPNATLVFRDGQQLSVRNYAIVGDSIWVLEDHNARKIPISKLDVAATQQINEKNGVEFHLPKQ